MTKLYRTIIKNFEEYWTMKIKYNIKINDQWGNSTVTELQFREILAPI